MKKFYLVHLFDDNGFKCTINLIFDSLRAVHYWYEHRINPDPRLASTRMVYQEVCASDIMTIDVLQRLYNGYESKKDIEL